MTKIWFNHWFSTAYNIINMIRRDNPEYHILGTNENERSVLSTVCDEWYTEPTLKGNDYVDFCMEFCERHKINVFMPRRELLSISRCRSDFEKLGVKVMVDSYEIVSTLNHKDRAYEYLKNAGVSTIPEYHIVTTVNDFLRSYHDLIGRYSAVCIKFVHDEGGKSYRLIDNTRKGYAALFKKQNTRMTLDAVVDALSERDKFAPLMVMPYLSGNELSVDCLQTSGGLIMLPRIKDATRIERMTFDNEVLQITQDIYRAIKLECPCNIQFKYLDGIPYFLEVNTRMSGGVQMACMAAGVNLPSIAIHKLLGINDKWDICTDERYLTHVELPIIL